MKKNYISRWRNLCYQILSFKRTRNGFFYNISTD